MSALQCKNRNFLTHLVCLDMSEEIQVVCLDMWKTTDSVRKKNTFNFSVNVDLKSGLTDIFTEYMDFNYKIFFNMEFCKTLIQNGIG